MLKQQEEIEVLLRRFVVQNNTSQRHRLRTIMKNIQWKRQLFPPPGPSEILYHSAAAIVRDAARRSVVLRDRLFQELNAVR